MHHFALFFLNILFLFSDDTFFIYIPSFIKHKLLKIMHLFSHPLNLLPKKGNSARPLDEPWNMSLVIIAVFCCTHLHTCSMPGLSGLRSGLVSTCSGMSLQPTRGISSQCLRTVRAKCSSVCFLRPVSQTKWISFHI